MFPQLFLGRQMNLFLILMAAVTILGPPILTAATIILTNLFSLMFQATAIVQKLFGSGGWKLSRGIYWQVVFIMFVVWLGFGDVVS